MTCALRSLAPTKNAATSPRLRNQLVSMELPLIGPTWILRAALRPVKWGLESTEDTPGDDPLRSRDPFLG
jgi:hypothetical protein